MYSATSYSTSAREEKRARYRHSVFKAPKKFSTAALSQGHPWLNIDGEAWYTCVRSKYTLSVTFSCCKASRIVLVTSEDDISEPIFQFCPHPRTDWAAADRSGGSADLSIYKWPAGSVYRGGSNERRTADPAFASGAELPCSLLLFRSGVGSSGACHRSVCTFSDIPQSDLPVADPSSSAPAAVAMHSNRFGSPRRPRTWLRHCIFRGIVR